MERAITESVGEQTPCPVCKRRSTREFLVRAEVPVHQNLLMRDQAAAVDIPRGNLELVACEECGFVFNRAFDPAKILYGADYENTQACSPSFNEYLDELVRHMVEESGVRNSRIVEVGCGNGLFLRKLVSYPLSGNSGYGFDPSYTGETSELNGRLQFFRRYYDSESTNIPADVVVCRHVIEHVPEPLQVLRNIRKALGNSPGARIFFETPCVEWILRNQVIWDFFYEHCSYFTADSLTAAMQTAGFRVESVRHVFSGQYLWLEATLPSTEIEITKHPGTVSDQAQTFAESEAKLKSDWEQKIRTLSSKQKVALWGAGAKGVTFANMIDPERCWIDCVVDLNPLKQGHFVPGTGHPIVSHEEMVARGVTSAILMNPNYREENVALLKAMKAEVQLIETL